jgi:uncharacterized protein with ParB-like and HNH nuclease domain
MLQELQNLELDEENQVEDKPSEADLAVNEETQVEDESSEDDVVAPVRYDISTYGADYDVEGLVKRLDRGDIKIADFQRNYIWNQAEASRFIESLLLGLPIPAIFFSKETQSNQFLVIDGQQRLKTLQFFYNGFFNPPAGEDRSKVFKLIKVQPEFEGLIYETLSDEDKRKLNDSLIHAIIVKQESPENDNTSIYHIFDRLNREGRRLTPQEIRTAVDYGKFIDLIKELNEYDNWRIIYGKKSSRLKDQELILRFLAFYFDGDEYAEPMKEFLNKFSQKSRTADEKFFTQARKVFTSTIDVVFESIGKKAFKPIRTLNAAVFDSAMVGLARGLEHQPISAIDFTKVRQAYEELLADTKYRELISRSTGNVSNVEERFRIACEKFSNILDAESRNC